MNPSRTCGAPAAPSAVRRVLLVAAFLVPHPIASVMACEQSDLASDSSGAPASRSETGTDATRPPRVAEAYRVPNGAIDLDGRLDEPVWSSVTPTSGFLQKEPVEGASPLERTDVFFCYDDRALYIGARMGIVRSTGVLTTMSRRDNTGNSERLIVSLDTYGDRRTAYTFGVTASGVRFDYYHPEDQEYVRQYEFDPVWEARVWRSDSVWTAELRIPFSQLRFTPTEVQQWGLNMNRFVPSTQEDLYWTLIPKQDVGWASRFGRLVGIRNIQGSRHFEIVPYSAGDLTLSTHRDRANPFDDGLNPAGRAGMDAKIGIGPNLTLDATINPDFGQVEADPAEVNISAYETFFEEKRPFFTEGARLLSGNGPSYFYSRRIGGPPHGAAAGDYTERVGRTTILGAAKLAGRLSSGLSVAALSALTAEENQQGYSVADATYRDAKVEPLTGFQAVRFQQEFGANASTVGVIATGVERDFRAGDDLADLLARNAVSGGADWNIRFDRGTYVLSGYAGGSRVAGTPAALARVQSTSARYYQRPDAGYVTLDSARTSLDGYTLGLSFEKTGGEHWLWAVSGSEISPGFEINDAGQLHNADDRFLGARLQYRETAPGPVLHGYSMLVQPFAEWNFGGARSGFGGEFIAQATWANFWSTYFRAGYELPAVRTDLTRGGPRMRIGERWDAQAIVDGNYSLPTTWEVYANDARDADGGWGWGIGASVTFRPSGRWECGLESQYTRSVDARQYIGTFPGGTPATYGMRYVFSSVDRSQLLARIRSSYAFTPDLTLELYVEPFAAGLHFSGFGELAAADTRGIRRYGENGTTIARDDASGTYTVTDGTDAFAFQDPDFFVLSLRSNLVLRWEWLRGSTLYLVWQQDRSHRDLLAAMASPRDLADAFGVSGTNYIALKISYWLPVD